MTRRPSPHDGAAAATSAAPHSARPAGQTAGSRAPLPPELDVRRLVRRLGLVALVALAVVAAVSALPGLGEVRERFGGARPAWLLAALAFELGSVFAFVAAFRGVFCGRLAWRLSYQVATAEQAANVLLPTGGAGGLALGAWALQRGGMPTDHIARRSVAFFLITSSVNFVAALLAGPAIALGLAGASQPLVLTLGPAALAAVAMITVLALPRVLGRRSARSDESVRRGLARAVAALTAGVGDAVALVGSRQPLVIGGAIGYMTLDVATLVAAFHAFGDAPPLAVLVLAYTIGQLGGLVPLPGGVAGTDGGLIAALVVYGTPAAAATAAVLAYRAFQLGVPALLGTVAFARLRHTLASSPAPAALCEPMAAAYEARPS